MNINLEGGKTVPLLPNRTCYRVSRRSQHDCNILNNLMSHIDSRYIESKDYF